MAIYDLAVVAILSVLSFILGAVFRPFFLGYSTKKGENLATYEDIQQVVEQVQAVTKTTEEIKAEISTGVWDKQKRWGMKRDVLFEATKRIAEVDNALLSYATVVKEDDKNQKLWATVPPTLEERSHWVELKHERQVRWSKASSAFDESRLFAGVVCGEEGKNSFEDLGAFINNLAAQLTKDPNAYDSSRRELFKKILVTQIAIRIELEVGR
jgi:hypothetical protein